MSSPTETGFMSPGDTVLRPGNCCKIKSPGRGRKKGGDGESEDRRVRLSIMSKLLQVIFQKTI